MREWDDGRVAQQVSEQIALEKQTIDVRVQQLSDEKADDKLKANQQWVALEQERLRVRQRRVQQVQGSLFWLGNWFVSGVPALCFWMASIVIYLGLGVAIGDNLADLSACNKGTQSLCYLLRIDKSRAILPDQRKRIVKEFLDSLKRHR